MNTVYEWILEEWDGPPSAGGEIIDQRDASDTLEGLLRGLAPTTRAALSSVDAAVLPDGTCLTVGLWRSVGSDADGLRDRQEAYFADLQRGRFPNGIAIPKGYIREWIRARDRAAGTPANAVEAVAYGMRLFHGLR